MKNKFNIKTKYFLWILVIALSFASCNKDFLDRQAQGQYNQNNYPFPTGAGPYDQYINAAYATLRGYNTTTLPFVAAVSIRSDDADKGSDPADLPDALAMDNFTLIATNGLVQALWTAHLKLIADCNYTLDKIKKDKNPVEASVKIDAEAQAKFLRGYAYFMMVRLFGRVPIIDSVTTSKVGGANIPQSSPAQVYAFIESDLQFAASNLLPSYDAKFIGRITQGAANGLLAKVYLTEKKYAIAMITANLVMKSGQYDLSTPYTKIFEEAGENSKESVFEVQATATAAEPIAFGSQYAQVQGIRGTNEWDLGFGFNTPSTALENAYENNDPRKARTILYRGGLTIYGEAVPTGLPNAKYNQKVYTKLAKRNSVGYRFGTWMNVRLLRYADVVLMYAEAANEVGGADNISLALNALNSIRARAREGNPNVLPDYVTTDQTVLRGDIRRERRVELSMENERFFDIVRWGIAAQVLQAQGKTFVVGKDELLPIPQQEIDLSKGVLTQNFGY